MKNTYLYIAVLFLIVQVSSSCKKSQHSNDQPDPSGKLYPVKFNVSGFSVSTESSVKSNSAKLTTTTTLPQDVNGVKYLFYLLYDSNGKLITKNNYTVADPTFDPVIANQLSAGSYYAVFFTAGATFNNGPTNKSLSDDGLQLSYFSNSDSQPMVFPETYYKKISFTVSPTGVNLNVILTRITSQVQVVIKDAIPANVQTIKVICNFYDNSTLSLFTGMPGNLLYGSSGYTTTDNVSGSTGATNFNTTPISLLGTTGLKSFTIQALSSSGGLMAYRTVSAVQLAPNTRTVLSGNLFSSDPANNGFQVGFEQIPITDLGTINF